MRGELPASARVEGAGLQLAFREWNAGAAGLPIVALHGITGSSADWHATALASRDRRVIAFDARGHGESDWDPDEAYTVDMHFADVATALDALGIDRCVLVGFSMGGGVAMVTAACLPERIAGLAVIDAYPHPEQTAGSGHIARWVAERAPLTRRFDPAIARRFSELLAAGFATRSDLRELWAAIQCPTLIVRGAESSVLPAEIAAEMIRMRAGTRLETIAGVAHDIPGRKADGLGRILGRFAGETERGCA